MSAIDYSKYKEATAQDLKIHLGVTMCPEQLKADLDFMVKEAEKRGYKDVRLQFESQYEPYEEWLGQPSVSPVGWIPLTEEDIQDEKEIARARLSITSDSVSGISNLLGALASTKARGTAEERRLLAIQKGLAKQETSTKTNTLNKNI